MKEVKKLYQVAVVLTETDKRLLVAVKNENDTSDVVLNLSGEEAVNRYSELMDVFDKQPTQN